MDKSLFNYELPEELIAQTPLRDRSSSRLMVLDRKKNKISHSIFSDIGTFLNKGDCLVINNTKVIPARLIGIKEDSDSRVELLLLKQLDQNRWDCIVHPGKKLKAGVMVSFGDKLKCRVEEVLEDGNRIVEFIYKGIFEEILDELGETPLPPYITEKLEDKSRYQTVYAKHSGSAAAPTAGLHFTEELLQELSEKGIIIANLTLHVGLGTFRPVKVENIEEHKMHAEYCEIEPHEAEKINKARENGGRIIAVGTTSVRTLEAFNKDGKIYPVNAETDIFIHPGHKFQGVDGIITNFHLPESTLIMLISAFAGREFVLEAYNTAVKEKYRFFSFGDAMLIL
ncbi:MAG: tRNA preQ1(34) S-adenosylmethionine ribosyltransferase-isomerase QueA [Defluviitaleaceae bacterium]|nr:tRNA preQ1(34) S-adenosylmethionine ribosyltransferase-isomerase QueA [Defluviitaleaceae bacterium]